MLTERKRISQSKLHAKQTPKISHFTWFRGNTGKSTARMENGHEHHMGSLCSQCCPGRHPDLITRRRGWRDWRLAERKRVGTESRVSKLKLSCSLDKSAMVINSVQFPRSKGYQMRWTPLVWPIFDNGDNYYNKSWRLNTPKLIKQ